MKTAPFEYHRPTTLDAGLELLAEHAETVKVIAGGQSLLPVMALRLSQPDHLIDIGGLSDLRGIDLDDGRIRVGAGVRQAEAERNSLVRNRIGVLADALGLIGHPAIRNRGTVGGSLAHADPAAELPAVAVALDARMVLRRGGGERIVSADEFFVSHLTTACAPSELLTTIDFRLPGEEAVWAVEEISRRHGDFALAGLVAVYDEDLGVRLAFFGLGATPIRARKAEEILADGWSESALSEAIDAVRQEITPDDDIHATAEYRRHVAGVLLQRCLRSMGNGAPR